MCSNKNCRKGGEEKRLRSNFPASGKFKAPWLDFCLLSSSPSSTCSPFIPSWKSEAKVTSVYNAFRFLKRGRREEKKGRVQFTFAEGNFSDLVLEKLSWIYCSFKRVGKALRMNRWERMGESRKKQEKGRIWSFSATRLQQWYVIGIFTSSQKEPKRVKVEWCKERRERGRERERSVHLLFRVLERCKVNKRTVILPSNENFFGLTVDTQRIIQTTMSERTKRRKEEKKKIPHHHQRRGEREKNDRDVSPSSIRLKTALLAVREIGPGDDHDEEDGRGRKWWWWSDRPTDVHRKKDAMRWKGQGLKEPNRVPS